MQQSIMLNVDDLLLIDVDYCCSETENADKCFDGNKSFDKWLADK